MKKALFLLFFCIFFIKYLVYLEKGCIFASSNKKNNNLTERRQLVNHCQKIMKTITSKSVQTKVAKNIKAEMEKALSIFRTINGEAEYEANIYDIATDKEVVITSNGLLNHIYSGSLTTMQEVMAKYEKAYTNVFYSIETRPISFFYKDELKMRYIPAFVATIRRKEA